jgi:hypothetical protein
MIERMCGALRCSLLVAVVGLLIQSGIGYSKG